MDLAARGQRSVGGGGGGDVCRAGFRDTEKAREIIIFLTWFTDD